MNITLPSVVMVLAGATLMYSAVKNKWPQDVIREALGQKATMGPIQAVWTTDLIPLNPSTGGGGAAPKYTGSNSPGFSVLPLTWPSV